MYPAGERKCACCEVFFTPDARNRVRQRYCAKGSCRRASKAASQQRWLSRSENTNYFRDVENAARVRAWQAAHPGYWKKRRKRPGGVLQDDCPPQPAPAQQVAASDGGAVLQEDWQRQPPLVIGLIAHLAGFTLQEDIAAMTGRLIAKGQAVLGASPGLAFPRC
jgi:hypothetical protein